ncbi:fasciclin domain-containing protein [Calothrix sp. PCC 6303]|uniref:fasciclin domain-containing protein n=1 Tax=Calothrix sp. PCC 6303 TaxID=1170562 RepID=UPI0002A00F7B|nr:fasciclin domain-containing protein [Calothrix sp. PCC 6303]AFZ03659.1 beta-Ig-H3/fasciclin [Calothrix sp. PCC 6303]
MRVNNSNFLTKLAAIAGVAGIGLLSGSPTHAQEKLNPSPSIFTQSPYNRTERVLINVQYQPAQPTAEAPKAAKKKGQIAQKRTLNDSPKILQECPYNRSACKETSGSSTPAPEVTPTPAPEAIPAPAPEAAPTPKSPSPSSEGNSQGKNIVATAEANGSFKTLTKALKAAGLTETLEGNGPFTVFAPTDAAFAKLPKDALADLLKPENKEVLVKILTYHVVGGQVLSSDLKSGEVKSSEGGAINVKVDPATGVTVNDAKVVQADVKASNGVIHVIDNVILPPDL